MLIRAGVPGQDAVMVCVDAHRETVRQKQSFGLLDQPAAGLKQRCRIGY